METLQKAWRAWKRLGQAIGDLMGRVVLTVLYFTLLVPFGLGVRLLGDPLALKPEDHVKWLDCEAREVGMEDARRLF